MEQAVWERRRITAIGIVLGYSLEAFLIPMPHPPSLGSLGAFFTSGTVYYALICPAVVWWWFAIFLRRRALKLRDLFLAYLAFGVYLSSALRATGIVCLQIGHLIHPS